MLIGLRERRKVRTNMYESPVHLILQDVESQIDQEIERTIITVVRKFDVSVDKGEIIKALRYDRNQYNKGYKDGVNDTLDKIRAEIEHIGGDDEKAFCKNLNASYKQGLKDALEVIDKYKVESEETK